jgi:hypothetical protein
MLFYIEKVNNASWQNLYSMSSDLVDYSLLSVNAGIMGAIFIFFAVASQASVLNIFNVNGEDCAYGFTLREGEPQIAISMAGGIIIIPFAISSILLMLRSRQMAQVCSITGFALIVVSAFITLTALSCRLPFLFVATVIVVPTVVTVVIVALLFGRRFASQFHSVLRSRHP